MARRATLSVSKGGDLPRAFVARPLPPPATLLAPGRRHLNQLGTTNTIAAAYSVRLIVTGYTGPLVNVQRSSDGALQDFYPTYANGIYELTTASGGGGTALSTWLSGTSGTVAKWCAAPQHSPVISIGQ